jgi:hemolysin III
MISSRNANEGFNAISHLVAAAIAVAGLVLLIVFSAIERKWLHLVSFSIYGTTVFVSMTLSSILHFFLWFKRYFRVFGILDHSAIYLLIAGTYTPFCLVVVGGGLGWSIFGVIWGLAILNIVLKSVFFTKMPLWLSMSGYLSMGWLSLALVWHVYSALGLVAILLLLLGGIFYTVGAAIFITEKPNPFPGKLAHHELWHILVMLGNLTFMAIMFLYVLPF